MESSGDAECSECRQCSNSECSNSGRLIVRQRFGFRSPSEVAYIAYISVLMRMPNGAVFNKTIPRCCFSRSEVDRRIYGRIGPDDR